ncbi:hypothetical protein Tco_0316164 [Tanacetum coccineum]
MGEYWVMIKFQSEEAKKTFQSNVDIEGIPLKMWSDNTFKRIASKWGTLIHADSHEDGNFYTKRICINTNITSNILESFKIIYRGKLFWVRAKEVSGWEPDFMEDNDDNSDNDDDLINDLKKDEELKGDSDTEAVPDTIFDDASIYINAENASVEKQKTHSEDPFNIYKLLTKNKENNHKEFQLWKRKGSRRNSFKSDLADLDLIIDKGCGDVEIVNKRANVVRSLQELREILIHWKQAKNQQRLNGAIEWPMRMPKYYTTEFSIKKRSQLAIRGILVDDSRLQLDLNFPNTLQPDQIIDLECDVSKDEIKRAVWDCGTDKSPGPDGFTFGFYRRYWNILESDVVDAVTSFFHHGQFPKGNNSLFIALIPKTRDANMVKDFRPISLIGSMYKIIAISCESPCSSSGGGVEQDQFDSLKAMVEGTSLVNIRDRWIWSLQSSGDFTIASIRKLIYEFTLSEDNLPPRWNISRRGLDLDSILFPNMR